MSVEIQLEARWQELVRGLAERLAQLPPGPMETVEVLVSSPGAARLLRQDLARELPGRICAGLSFLTTHRWLRQAAERHGLGEEHQAWRSVRSAMAAMPLLAELANEHNTLGAHLDKFKAAETSTRRQQLATRSMRLFRRYVEQAPDMVANWLAETDVDAEGQTLAEHLSWQPELLRRVSSQLGVDPVALGLRLDKKLAAERPPRHLHVFALPEVAVQHRSILRAAAKTHSLQIWHIPAEELPDWTLEFGPAQPPPASPSSPARIDVHGSHGPARQVEVLRDELVRRFEEHPHLEPRDVVIVCDNPRSWWPHLRSAFAPAPDDAGAHPGRQLRLETGSRSQENLARELVLSCLRLDRTRATATELTELFLMGPVAERWGLDRSRDQLLALVDSAGIRWGLDGTHRGEVGLEHITQNTWFRGLDRLLAGAALSPGGGSELAVRGVETVATSDLMVIGAMAELVSRLRRFHQLAKNEAPAAEWTARIRELLDSLTAFTPETQWMHTDVSTALAKLAEELGPAGDHPLTRSEFTKLFEQASAALRSRPNVGNGGMHVIGVGELAHAHYRLVCLLGLDDSSRHSNLDSVNLGKGTPDPRRQRLADLLRHARSADEVLLVFQTRDQLTGNNISRPTTVSWLLEKLGHAEERVKNHPLLAHSFENFSERPGGDHASPASFDLNALAAAVALQRRSTKPESTDARRSEPHQMGAMASQAREGAPDPTVSVTGEASAPRSGRAVGENRWIQAENAEAHTVRRHAVMHLPTASPPVRVDLAEMGRFLRDPAREFLRSALEVRLWEPAALRDELPFRLNELGDWQLRDRILDAFKDGLRPNQALAREVAREQLPPGQLGRFHGEKITGQVVELWRRAHHDWSGEVEEHEVELDLGDAVLLDVVRTKGRQIVEVTASDGIQTALGTWLGQLALAAAGKPTPAVVHHLERDYGDRYPASFTLQPPAPDEAWDSLRHIAAALRQGRSRLIPLPLDLGLEFASQTRGGKPLAEASWQHPAADWRNTLWRRMGPAWPLFYGGVPQELFSDPATKRDPEPPAAHPSAFAAWASAIYLPMIQAAS